MIQSKKYQYFYILKCTSQKQNIDVIENNVTYRDGLKLFKKLRLELEATATDFIYIMLVGVTFDNTEVVVKKKEISPHCDFIENMIDDSNISENALEQNAESFIAEEGLDKNLDVDKEDTIEFNEYVEKLNKYISNDSIENDNLNDIEKNKFIEDEGLKDSSSKVKSLSAIKLKECYRHISEISSKDIIRILIDAFSILEEKHTYNSDMIDLLTKKRDCYFHDFENLDKMPFKSIDEQNQFVLSLGANMHSTGIERRNFKNEYSMTEQVFKNLPKIRPAYYNPLIEIENNVPKFNIEKAVNIKTYSYTYDTEEDREILLKDLNKKFDKVIDISWGKIECYNKVGSVNSKKILKEVENSKKTTSDETEKIDIIDELSAKSYESIINQTVKCGSTFLKTKGSSVKITNVNRKAASHLTNHIQHKYSKCAYDCKSKSLYLIKRL